MNKNQDAGTKANWSCNKSVSQQLDELRVANWWTLVLIIELLLFQIIVMAGCIYP